MIERYENLLIDLTTSSDDRRTPNRRIMSAGGAAPRLEGTNGNP